MQLMQPLKAQVRNGHLVLDEPTDLPEGEVVYLVPAEEAYDDQLDDEELQRELEAGIAELKAGLAIDGETFMARLRART